MCGHRVRSRHADYFSPKAVRKRKKLCQARPFFLRRLVKGKAQQKFVIAAKRVVNFGPQISIGRQKSIYADFLRGAEWQFAGDAAQPRNWVVFAQLPEPQRKFPAKVRS